VQAEPSYSLFFFLSIGRSLPTVSLPQQRPLVVELGASERQRAAKNQVYSLSPGHAIINPSQPEGSHLPALFLLDTPVIRHWTDFAFSIQWGSHSHSISAVSLTRIRPDPVICRSRSPSPVEAGHLHRTFSAVSGSRGVEQPPSSQEPVLRPRDRASPPSIEHCRLTRRTSIQQPPNLSRSEEPASQAREIQPRHRVVLLLRRLPVVSAAESPGDEPHLSHHRESPAAKFGTSNKFDSAVGNRHVAFNYGRVA
jgi:hypothetical protein